MQYRTITRTCSPGAPGFEGHGATYSCNWLLQVNRLLTFVYPLRFVEFSAFAAEFANGWTLDAADAVCAGDGVADEHVLDALLQLIRKSMVAQIDVRHGSARYGLLETLRQYA
jgi:hypothetical protein